MGKVSLPFVNFQIIPARTFVGVEEQKVLIVGQMLSGGTATAGELITEIPNDGSENALFGQRSHLAGLVRTFKKYNKQTRLDVIALDDAGDAVQATSVSAFSGTATEDGTLIFSVGSQNDHQYSIDILTGDTATEIGDALAAAITADANAPFTAANVTGTVTITAENGGAIANEWSIAYSGTVAGVSVTLTGWTGGATDPTLTSVLDVIGDIRYQTIVWPTSYTITTVETVLNDRFNTANEVLDGVAVQVIIDTLANAKTYVSTLNSQNLNIIVDKTIDLANRKGSAHIEMPDISAVTFAAIRSLRRTDDAGLTQFLTTVAPADQFGGIALASLPYFNTAMGNLKPAKQEDFFTQEELSELTDNGVSYYGPNRAGNATIMGEMVTTYLTDLAGNPDESYKFLNTVDTISAIREYYFANFKAKYAQTRLVGNNSRGVPGDLIARRDMANEPSIRAFCGELYDELAEVALTQAGRDAKSEYLETLSVIVDASEGKVTVDQAPLLVSQLRVVLGTIAVNFGG